MIQPAGSPQGRKASPMRSIASGVLLLARGRAEGLQQFGDTPRAALGALAPVSAFIIAGLALGLLGGASLDALSDMSGLAIGFLAQLVFSYEVARRWGQAEAWFRFATAFCWCQWAGPLAVAAFLIIMALMMVAGVPSETAAAAGMLGLFGYGLWLHWFLARTALHLSALRAMALVLIVNALTSAVVLLPQLAAMS